MVWLNTGETSAIKGEVEDAEVMMEVSGRRTPGQAQRQQ